jgi:hypothetical protein
MLQEFIECTNMLGWLALGQNGLPSLAWYAFEAAHQSESTTIMGLNILIQP